ncbi:transporter substrate-binding domain-containing protein [Maritalea porphyrae]|uniref:Ectoine/hydroxyectoine ABC transporter substrate-binding protein EhuB n=1 Tax=Maritalea porphyrae TaxID=880732 RepID=A0ABQ5UR04_9HYPH|nr:transporter substrate-binding domain-containing protein [Maritalea porphyrae]GLQ17696.1 ectoine/hydroxyectoine ABC transporter substrate-binding protein EhuB [Maritalea porphyrae]
MNFKMVLAAAAAASLTAFSAVGAYADNVKIGFANEVPWAYPGEGNEPLGFVNVIAQNVLEIAGYDGTDSVVSEWGGLIPGLEAGRSDMVTGGLYITPSRCNAIAFSDPIMQAYDAFVMSGDAGVTSYQDIIDAGGTFVTGAGYNQVAAWADAGGAPGKILEVPGPAEIVAAVEAGRAMAGGVTVFTAAEAIANNDNLTMTAIPGSTYYVGFGFTKSNHKLRTAVNAAIHQYVGTDKMLADVAEYGYSKANLPGDTTVGEACLLHAND